MSDSEIPRSTRSSKLPLLKGLVGPERTVRKKSSTDGEKTPKTPKTPKTEETTPPKSQDEQQPHTSTPVNKTINEEKLNLSNIKLEDSPPRVIFEFNYEENTSRLRYENIVFNPVDPTEDDGHTTRVGHSTFYRTVDSPIEEELKANESKEEEEDEVFVSQEEQKSLTNPENNESGPRSPEKSQHSETEPRSKHSPKRSSSRQQSPRKSTHTSSSSLPNYEDENTMSEPKYTQPLTRSGLKLFLTNFEMWAMNKKLDFKGQKMGLPLAIQNDVAQQWFIINKSHVTDDKVTFELLVDKFLKECPMDGEDENLGFIEVLSRKQKPTEKASVFMQRIRYLLEEEWSKFNEKDVVHSMCRQLSLPLRRYIECRGSPSTYEELIGLVLEYETECGQEDESITIKKEKIGIHTAPAQPLAFDMEIIKDKIDKMDASIKMLSKIGYQKNSGKQQEQGRDNEKRDFRTDDRRGRNFQNAPKCNYCHRPGHMIANCRTRMNANRNAQRWSENANYRSQEQQPQQYYGQPSYQYQGNGQRWTQ
jgi:hypothetical protein